jgi:hypothetical protein
MREPTSTMSTATEIPPGMLAALAEAVPSRDDRRVEKRLAYRCRQRVAYCSDLDHAPGDFHDVIFRDLSTHGCSFLALESPPVNELVIEFGQAPNFIYMVAQVVRAMPVEFDGRQFFTVACRFTGRSERWQR